MPGASAWGASPERDTGSAGGGDGCAGAAVGGAARRRRPPGRLAPPDPFGYEPVLQEPSCVAEGEAARLGPEDHEEETLARTPGRHGQVVARLVGEAGLERLHAAGIVE